MLSQNTCRLRRLGRRGHSAPTRARAGKAIGSEAHLLWIQENTIARGQRAREPGEDEKRAREFFHTVLRERIDAAAAEQGVAVKAAIAVATLRRHSLPKSRPVVSVSSSSATVVIPASGANCLAALPTALAIWRAVTFSLFEKRRDYKIFGDSCRLKSVPDVNILLYKSCHS